MFKLFTLPEIDVVKYSHLSENDLDFPIFYQMSFLNSLSDILKDRLVVGIIYEGEEIQCAMPGIIKGRTFEALTYTGFDNLDIIVDKKYSSHELKRQIIDCILKKFDLIKLSNFKSIDSEISSFYYKKIHSYKCPIIHLPDHFSDYLRLLNKSFKKKIRWEMNYAEKMGIEITYVNSGDSKQSVAINLKMLYKLHEKRILSKNIQSSFLFRENRMFHNQIVNRYNAKVLFTEAWYQGNCVGILYGFINQNKYYFFNSGIDTNIPKIGIGTLLIAHTIKYLISNDIFMFDFLRGKEKYKYHWTKNEQENYTYYITNENTNVLRMWKKYLQDQRLRYGGRLLLKKILSGDI